MKTVKIRWDGRIIDHPVDISLGQMMKPTGKTHKTTVYSDGKIIIEETKATQPIDPNQGKLQWLPG